MIKLNDSSKNLNILSDAQLTQVVGGRGHGSKHHDNDYRCHGGRRNDRDCYNSYDRGCDDYSYNNYGCDGYDYGCSYGGYDKGSDK